MVIEQAKKTAAAGNRKEAIALLEKYVREHGEDEEILLCLGELVYAEGQMPAALNKFNAVLRMNPENRKAANYVNMINGILDYYCKDLLNP